MFVYIKGNKKMKFEWERIGGSNDNLSATYRVRIFGGWLVNNYTMIETGNCGEKGNERMGAESMVFVPDQDHLWEID